tara:strand:+ start:2386 stop:2607 length:222 start_codon:yes stop_codon:yes gene_type:complete
MPETQMVSHSLMEIMDYWRQEKTNRKRYSKPASPEAMKAGQCTVTGTGHYWIVSPPPNQLHKCKTCGITKIED